MRGIRCPSFVYVALQLSILAVLDSWLSLRRQGLHSSTPSARLPQRALQARPLPECWAPRPLVSVEPRHPLCSFVLATASTLSLRVRSQEIFATASTDFTGTQWVEADVTVPGTAGVSLLSTCPQGPSMVRAMETAEQKEGEAGKLGEGPLSLRREEEVRSREEAEQHWRSPGVTYSQVPPSL